MAKLSDIQLILLTTAAARKDGSLLPPPEKVGKQLTRIRRTISTLLQRGLVEEVNVAEAERSWREKDQQQFGVVITAAGREAIGVEEGPPAPSPTIAQEAALSAGPTTKVDTVLTLLRRSGGATLAEMVAATGWLPHTTRAALTRLRQKGHGVEKESRDGATAYLIKVAAWNVGSRDQAAALGAMSPSQLRAEWRQLYGKEAPPLSPGLLRHGIACRLQEKRHGGLDPALRRELEALASKSRKTEPVRIAAARTKPGTRLVRDWGGTSHHVLVEETGFTYRGQRYSSLSIIAAEITGARWSGPRFFGLRRNAKELAHG